VSDGFVLVVSGTRNAPRPGQIESALAAIRAGGTIRRVFVGDSRGVDTIACRWLRQAKIKHTIYEAEWSRYGSAAGPLRNECMVKAALGVAGDPSACLLLAFPLRGSRSASPGTWSTIEVAVREGIRAQIIPVY
jgi:hypothetical protein